MNRFVVKTEHSEAFEERWRKRQSFLKEAQGFMRFRLLRSIQSEAVEFVSHSEWRDKADFEQWLEGDLSKKAHSQGKPGESKPAGDMFLRPPEFRAYETLLDEVPGYRVDARSGLMDQIVTNRFANESAGQIDIRKKALEAGLPPINIGPFEGRILEILLRANGSRRGVEIGTLGGYSASWIARALPADGHLTSLELEPKNAKVAAELLAGLGLSKKVEIKVGDAIDTLKTMSDVKDLDFVFVDADKPAYPDYVRWAIPRLRKGGLLLVDNAYIWGGMLYFGQKPDQLTYDDSMVFRKNQFSGMSDCWNEMAAHPEMASIIFSTGDGLGVAVKI